MFEYIESVVEKIHSTSPFFSLEINPKLSAKLQDKNINELKSFDSIDAFVVTDSPLARFKPSSIISSIKLQNILQKPIICTLSMRDRNSIALCGDILAANELGLRLFLTLTGDGIKNSDCEYVKGVFEGTSNKLATIIDDLNNGIAINKKKLIEKPQKIYYFAVINSYANNLQSIKKRMIKKLSNNNISALYSQPVFSKDRAELLLSNINEANALYGTNTALVLGFFAITSYKTAVFLRDKLPGIYIPDKWIESLYKASQKGVQEEQKVGLELSLNLFSDLKTIHNKFHLMSRQHSILKHFI
ncbi:methylenetetrahydrofolate reductase [Helicobacter sp. MIT 99-5507]|uniref:methylenetetrahydrofolate reductase n=1 Tax=Helicobacter sp. MIT 99-5507 TaxID=152489 RepID=UPI000E1E6680|nr:methylenetetrahydrofolate reductase [Helicobacter sp. MIT 99-5507]RDU58158.1 methylenetetrahydrofolate reductase [Helicobacter sp. MIT 99-5507]